MNTNAELHKVIDSWHERSSKVQDAHYEAGNMYERRFLQLGIPVIVLSAVIGGTEVIVPVGLVDSSLAKNISGVISLVVAILAGLQTFLKLSQRSERHRMAGARYGDVRRSLETINIVCSQSDDDAMDKLEEIKTKMDSLAIESPEIPSGLLNKYRGV